MRKLMHGQISILKKKKIPNMNVNPKLDLLYESFSLHLHIKKSLSMQVLITDSSPD